MVLAGAGAALLGGGCSQDMSRRPFLAADAHPIDYPTVQAVVRMGEQLQEKSDGKFSVKMFAGGQLGSERDTIEITTFGGLDLIRIPIATLNSIEPLSLIPSLPFLFRSTAHMRRALDGDAGDRILASLEPHGMIGLCFYDSGERSFYNTKGPILTPDDMKGLKIRVQNSDLYVSMIKALGADATPMSFGEVYQALVQGVIDGAENNWPSYHGTRHFEAANYYSLTRHVMAPEMLVMSTSRWNKLSPSERALVRDTARDSVPYMRTLWDERVEQSRDFVLKAGVTVNEIPDLTLFSDRMRPVWNDYILTPEQTELVRMIEQVEG
jgi:tripartite ATP-independent transporter DctP family solute receptor